MTAETLNFRQTAATPYVRAWLFGVAALIFCMVIVGGATRLTDSGLSITEWKPLLGAIPPMTEAQWLDAFRKYQQIPEYHLVNKGMSLAEFEFIYWWEWSHRFLGRVIGLAFFLPFAYFAVTGALNRSTAIRCGILFILGGLQGALGWYMVASGLVGRVDVSQYRLAAHLSLATFIYGAILWVGFGLGRKRHVPETGGQWLALLIAALVLLQIAAGGFVAGLDAGFGYNSWPLIDGAVVPKGLFAAEPWWRNLFENALTVQFNHRNLAYVIFLLVAAQAYAARSRASLLLLLAVLAQIALGVWTLLWAVPLWLGLAHQGGAMVVFAAAIWNLHTMLKGERVPVLREVRVQ
ncbi:MAG: COX15/CtaA family protein [Aestuariivirga sp.]|uniref:COX15/CtaA family protein n=1 Tax=Aestuariivirga sp. TaxID=2650926 RepID=UPI0025C68808|nr:COX15/CtaA family protein [Aestuariivirga sp.]MCA3561294.1 COX15/CtaA family protein [Aestuariivirga sp.]